MEESKMKKFTKATSVLLSFAMFTGVFFSCESTKQVEVPSTVVIPQSTTDTYEVIDWLGRSLGEPAAPDWLKGLIKGNADVFKAEKGLDNSRVVKLSQTTARTEAEAKAFSRADFAYSQVAELNQKVIGRVGQGLNDEGQLEALYMVASESKADMVGLREELFYWQKIRVTDTKTEESNTYYIGYMAYSMEKATWDRICQNYLLSIISDERIESETKASVGALFSEMKEDADKIDAKKAEEEKKLYDEQMARINAAKAQADAEIANANAQTAKANAQTANATAETARANAQTAKAKAEEQEARARAEEARKWANYYYYLR